LPATRPPSSSPAAAAIACPRKKVNRGRSLDTRRSHGGHMEPYRGHTERPGHAARPPSGRTRTSSLGARCRHGWRRRRRDEPARCVRTVVDSHPPPASSLLTSGGCVRPSADFLALVSVRTTHARMGQTWMRFTSNTPLVYPTHFTVQHGSLCSRRTPPSEEP
jgi:hypothetical protein